MADRSRREVFLRRFEFLFHIFFRNLVLLVFHSDVKAVEIIFDFRLGHFLGIQHFFERIGAAVGGLHHFELLLRLFLPGFRRLVIGFRRQILVRNFLFEQILAEFVHLQQLCRLRRNRQQDALVQIKFLRRDLPALVSGDNILLPASRHDGKGKHRHKGNQQRSPGTPFTLKHPVVPLSL